MAYTPKNPNGQATMANSEPVVIASDQSAVPVSATSLPLPTGASTEAKQDTIIGHVDGIESTLGTIDADTSILSSATQVEDAAYTAAQRIVMSGGVRRDSDTTPVSTDGDVHPFIFEETGRLKVATFPGSVATYTDNITSNGDTVSLDVSRYSNLTIHCTGTFSTVNVTFEGSINGGTTWFTVQGVRTSANTVETTTGNLSAAPAYAWEFSVNALTNFRVRATAYTSGTQVWVFSPGTYATEPIPAVQTHAVTGSGNFAVTMAANATTTPAKARDGAAGGTDTGIPAFCVRRDTPTAVTPAAGDWEVPQISANGEQWVRLAGELADDAAATLGTTRVVPIGGVAVQTDGTDPASVSAEGDAAVPRTDMNRILLVNQTHPRGTTVSADYASAQTNTSVIAAPGASLSIYITDIMLSNGATAGNVTLLDGSGGTVKWEAYPAVNGGAVLNLRQPIKLTANTALCITSTTVTTHSIFIGYYIAA